MSYNRVSVVGLGKLGLCLAACISDRGIDTIGIDIDDRTLGLVNQGRAPWFEKGLDELLARNVGRRLRVTSNHTQAIEETDVTFVLVATPSASDGSFSNQHVETALTSLAHALALSDKPHHSFVISSTVMPGSTQASFIPLLESVSGKKLHEDFSVCYDPDFVALGNAVHGFLRPDLVVIGESDAAAGASLDELHRRICENTPAISRMSIINAELAKICLNTYITTKISFANSIANLCDRIPGADADCVTDAIGADRRISPHYFRGGLSFGGTCFPRDIRAYLALAEKYEVQAELLHATNTVNQKQDEYLAQVVLDELGRERVTKVAVIGLAFTAGTAVITESPSLKLIHVLLKHGIRIVTTDPLAIQNARADLGDRVEYRTSPKDCLDECSVVVAMLRDDSVKQTLQEWRPSHRSTLIDPWRMVHRSFLAQNIRYLGLGRAADMSNGSQHLVSEQAVG